jgi:hypothetical protein
MRFIPEYEIEAAAQDVLATYQKKHGLITERVPIDNIVERHLGIHLESFDDTHLPEGFQNLVLGYIDLRNQSIGIHESLFPEISGNDGRYHFTLAHEVGHFILHRDEIFAEEGHFGCFEQEDAPRDLSPMEWQADCFAGHLLMPEMMVRRYWKARTKSENPLTPEQIARRFNMKTREKCCQDVLVWLYIRRIADRMGVSAQALSIRLKRMGLIANSEPLAETGT